MTPRPVASTRPREPPRETGFPVTTDVTVWPTCIEYVSMTHAIVCESVPTSGAGTSRSGPKTSMSSAVYRRVILSSSPRDSLRGSQITPPLPPPNGMFMTAHFHVIQDASARTSSSVTPGSYRTPPLAGPRTTLWWTR